MRRFAIVLAFATAAGAAQAGQSPATQNAQGAGVDAVFTARTGKVVFVCDGSMETRRAFIREYGRQEFVTADQALNSPGGWSAPKCVTPGEARRLQQALSKRS